LSLLLAGFFGIAAITTLSPVVWTADVAPDVLAFYYGWYGNPQLSGERRHCKNVNPGNERIEGMTRLFRRRRLSWPRSGGRRSSGRDDTYGRNQRLYCELVGAVSFEDRGMPLLHAAARKHKLAVSAYYEEIAGEDAVHRVDATVGDIDYLPNRYGGDKAWLRASGRPVLCVYSRVLHELPPADLQEVLAHVRHDNPGGVVLVADSLDPMFVSLFGGTST
jgi:hypothetical protein